MDDQQLLRYSRHILVDEIGIEGQEKLLASHALIIGAGGLGSPAALYLASAGVGTLSIADGDTVDLSNLQRQILHSEARIGQNKTLSAEATLHSINSECRVLTLPRLEGDALIEAVSKANVVLDCSDNFATRYALNRACVALKKPLISGAAIKLTGQIFVVDPRQPDAPCYACLYPEDSEDDELRCATTGILAPVTGVVGCMQAVEAIKLLAGFGIPVRGLQRYNALTGIWSRSGISKDPACKICEKFGT